MIFPKFPELNQKMFVGVQGFKVAFSPPDCIWDADFREKRQLRQSESKTWSQIGNYLGK